MVTEIDGSKRERERAKTLQACIVESIDSSESRRWCMACICPNTGNRAVGERKRGRGKERKIHREWIRGETEKEKGEKHFSQDRARERK